MDAGITTNSPLSDPAPAVAVSWERVEKFVGQLVHDIRNGLNALELQLTLLGELSTEPEAAEEVRRLRGSLHEITRQLQSVKSATSMTGPHLLLYPAADFFEDLRERVERRFPEAASKVSWTIPPGTIGLLFVDPDLTINGLLELFANTFRFAGEAVRCTVADGAGHLSFTLEEKPVSAPAIAPSLWGREPLLTSTRGTYGLGLFRARRIVESQGGSLQAAYDPEQNVLRVSAALPRPTDDPV